jgi:hypothetical protein
LDRYDVKLSELQFDERNEIMFERMLIARDAAEQGDDTGTIRLGAIEAIEEKVSARDERISASPPRKPSKPPPMPAKTGARRSTPPAKPAAEPLPKRKSLPPTARSAPTRTAAVSDDGYQLAIDPTLVARARSLEQRLPRRVLDRDRPPGKPEAAVLTVALRLGLAALGAIADDD